MVREEAEDGGQVMGAGKGCGEVANWRVCCRCYGPLKDEYRNVGQTHRRAVSEAASGQLQAERPDVLPGPNDVPDTGQERLNEGSRRRKESVAKMTWDGVSYLVTVSRFLITLGEHRIDFFIIDED